jgi:flagellar protein FlgJ
MRHAEFNTASMPATAPTAPTRPTAGIGSGGGAGFGATFGSVQEEVASFLQNGGGA